MSPFGKKNYSLDYIWLLLEKLSLCGWNWENRALPHPRDKVKLVVEGVLKKSYLYRKPTVGRKRKQIIKNKYVTLIKQKKNE